MTKELIVQSIKDDGINVFVDFQCNGIWCKTAIEPMKFTRYLIEECGIMAQRKNFREWLKLNDILGDYLFHALHDFERPLQFVILDEYHVGDLAPVYNLLRELKIPLS